MTPEELSTAIALGREQRNTEFKGPGLRSNKPFLAKVIRAILGMANKPDGGVVVVGVEDDDTRLLPVGLSPAELKTWTYDDLHSSVSNYADPYVDFEVVRIQLDGKDFVAIKIQEFSDIPVICKRDCGNTLRNGALYVRRRGKNETVEIPSHVEMREVIERAAENVARRMLATVSRIGPPTVPSADKYDQEAEDIL